MKKSIITTALAATMALTPMLPSLAAHAATNSTTHITVSQMETELINLYNTLPTWPHYPLKPTNGFGIGLKYLVGGNSNASAAADPATVAMLFPSSTNNNAAVTANQVAGWIIRWATAARNVNLTAWAAKSEFQLVQLWGIFAGSGVTKGTDTITAKQEQTILANMKQAFGEVDTVNPFKIDTMQSEIQQLIKWENTVPVWPAGLETYDPNSGTAFWKNPSMKIPESKWFGLAPVYGPNVKGLQIESAYEPQLPMTAGVLAHWIISFEKDARQLNMSLEPTQNEFQLVQDFGVFQGTGITSPTQILTAKQSNQIMGNLNAVTYGVRVNENKVQFVEPLMSVQGMVIDWEGLSEINKSLKNDWPSAYGQLIKMMDTMSLTFEPGGKIVYNRAKSNQIGLGLDVAYVTQTGHVSSELYRAGGTNYAKPSAFNLSVPFTYSPTENTTSYNIKGFQYKLKNNGDVLVSVMFMPFNRETWKVDGYTIAPQPRYLVEFNKQTGNVVAVSLYGQAGQNYPAEVGNVE